MKTIHLCADDFGLNEGVSHAILDLIARKRLSATSCMVTHNDFQKFAPDLLALRPKVQIGLHFNLTFGDLLTGLKTYSLQKLILLSHLRLLPLDPIAKEFQAQLNLFQNTMGHLPDFIDGHQHIHQFPLIRELMHQGYTEALRNNNTYIRATAPAITLQQYAMKGRILNYTGAKSLQKILHDHKIPHNSYFSGVYDFKVGTNYRSLFRQWLQLIPNDTLIMCHPGEGESSSDEIAATRTVEYAYFKSHDFLTDCEQFGVQLNDKPRSVKA